MKYGLTDTVEEVKFNQYNVNLGSYLLIGCTL